MLTGSGEIGVTVGRGDEAPVDWCRSLASGSAAFPDQWRRCASSQAAWTAGLTRKSGADGARLMDSAVAIGVSGSCGRGAASG